MAKLGDFAVDFVRRVFSREKGKSELAISSKELARSQYGGFRHTGIDVAGVGGIGEVLGLDRRLLHRYADYEEMDEYGDITSALDIYCLSGDTVVPLVSGDHCTLRELYESGKKDFWVYSYDELSRKVTAGLCRRAVKTGKNKPVYRVVFDDGTELRMTGTHEVVMLNGDRKYVKDLLLGDSVCALIRLRTENKSRKKLYENVLVEPFKRLWRSTHRMTLDALGEAVPNGHVVHHKDHDGLNNSPDNLLVVDHQDHLNLFHNFRGKDNPRFRSDVVVDDLLMVLSDEYISKTEAQRRLNCGFRVLDRLVLEAGYKSWTHMKQSVFGLDRRSRGHGRSALTAKQDEISRKKVEEQLLSNPGISLRQATLKAGLSYKGVWRALRERWGFGGVQELRDDIEKKKTVGRNHKVVSVELAGDEDVFCLENVTPCHNFAVGSSRWDGAGLNDGFVFVGNSDDATQRDSTTNHTVWVDCQDEAVRVELERMFYKQLQIEEDVWEIARTLCKYGNDFEEIVIGEGGVQALKYLPPATVRRVEGKRGDLMGFVQSFTTDLHIEPEHFKKMKLDAGGAISPQGDAAVFEDWRVAHMRLRSKHRESMYGWAITEPARWVWKRLMLLEDAVMVYKLTRSPSRYAFYIDVGSMPRHEAERAIEEVKNRIKKKKFVNPKTGKLDLKFNPLAFDEDFFLGMRDGAEKTRVDVLSGPSYQQVEDVQYFLHKLYAALKVPRAYLGYDENMPSKATLSQEDVRFARTVLRVQREIINGLAKIARVHLSARRIDPASVDFEIKMTVPSAIFELGQMEVRRARADLASMMERHVSMYWLLRNIYGLSDDEIEEVSKQKKNEQKALGAMGGQQGLESFMPRERGIPLGESKGISAKELMDGNREHEKRVEGFVKREMNKQSSVLGEQLRQNAAFLKDLARTSMSSRA